MRQLVFHVRDCNDEGLSSNDNHHHPVVADVVVVIVDSKTKKRKDRQKEGGREREREKLALSLSLKKRICCFLVAVHIDSFRPLLLVVFPLSPLLSRQKSKEKRLSLE